MDRPGNIVRILKPDEISLPAGYMRMVKESGSICRANPDYTGVIWKVTKF